VKITVLKHEKSKNGYFFKHKALVQVEDYSNDVEDLINETSIKVGYHPLGYGVYGGRVSKSTKENEYIIVWETGTSAD
jgi:hypothetical protein